MTRALITLVIVLPGCLPVAVLLMLALSPVLALAALLVLAALACLGWRLLAGGAELKPRARRGRASQWGRL